MARTWKDLENRRLAAVAREYRRKGYRVVVRPIKNELPRFLESFHPDMIAMGKAENVVVEVKSSNSLPESPDVEAMASAVREHGGWRFDLVVTNPKNKFSVEDPLRTMTEKEITGRLETVEALLKNNVYEAAMLMASACVESALRLLIRREGLTIPQGQSQASQLASALAYNGLITEEEYQVVRRALDQRNYLVHGYNLEHVDVTLIRGLWTLTKRIVDRTPRSEEETRPEPEFSQRQEKLRIDFQPFIATSGKMRHVSELVEKVAPTDVTVLISGETGTGKSLIARAIHYRSSRRSNPFVSINCAALPEPLIESELFGYEKGAFAYAHHRKVGHFELGHGGTVFLDEIGELGFETQAKLLSAIESKTITPLGGADQIGVDVRVIAATNRDLSQLVSTGSFRSDLFYRLNVFPVQVPPLRERKEDIHPLVNHFLRVKAQEQSVSPKNLSAEVVDCMMSYPWPGNVRELENLVERLTMLSSHEALTLADLPEVMVYWNRTDKLLQASRPLDQIVADFERDVILRALQKTRFNEARAASLLGTTSKHLHSLIEKLRIRPREMGES